MGEDGLGLSSHDVSSERDNDRQEMNEGHDGAWKACSKCAMSVWGPNQPALWDAMSKKQALK